MIGSLRAIAKDTFVYGFGDFVLRGASLFTFPIYTRLLDPSDYGRWSLVLSAVGLVGGFLSLGGDTAYARFFFGARDDAEKRLITTTWMAFLAAWSFGVTLVALPFASHYSDWAFHSSSYASLFVLALAATPVTLMNTMLGQVLRNEFRAKLYTVLNVASTLAFISFGMVGAFVAERPLVGILAGGLIGTAAFLPLRIWYARHWFARGFSTTLLRQLLAFGVPLVPAGLAWWIFGTSDRIVLGKLGTISDVGLYSVAIGLSSFLALFVNALGLAWSPHSFHVYENQLEDAPAFFGRVATYIVLGFGILSVLVSTFAHEILVLLSTKPYYGAAVAVGPLALGYVAYASTQVTAASLSLRKKTIWFSIISWSAALLNIALNLLLVPRWGMLASAWATFVAYLFLTVAYFLVGQRLWAIAYEGRRITVAALLTLAFSAAVPLLPHLNLLESFALKIPYLLVFVALLTLFGAVDGREWTLLRRFSSRIRSPRPRAA